MTQPQTQSRTISFFPNDVLFQYFTKAHLDTHNNLTEEEWEEFLYEYQDGFAEEATEMAKEMMANFMEEKN